MNKYVEIIDIINIHLVEPGTNQKSPEPIDRTMLSEIQPLQLPPELPLQAQIPTRRLPNDTAPYLKILGTHGIYHRGWIAGTRHSTLLSRPPVRQVLGRSFCVASVAINGE
jgi:hypothetical protein